MNHDYASSLKKKLDGKKLMHESWDKYYFENVELVDTSMKGSRFLCNSIKTGTKSGRYQIYMLSTYQLYLMMKTKNINNEINMKIVKECIAHIINNRGVIHIKTKIKNTTCIVLIVAKIVACFKSVPNQRLQKLRQHRA